MLTSSTDVARVGIERAEDKLRRVLGPSYSSYRARWEEASRECADMVHLDVELVDACNQSCIMCPRNRQHHPILDYELGTAAKLDFNKYSQAIEDLVGIGLVSVNFGGFAEPFVHKQWRRFVTRAHELGVLDTRLITNGLLLSRNIQDIFESRLRNLYVSIDASSESSYSAIRGAGFSQVVKSLEDFLLLREQLEVELPVVRVSFVVLDENEREVDDFIDRWASLVDHVDIQRKFDYKPVHRVGPARWNCDQPWKRMSILANGDVIPCCSFNGRSLVIGSIYDDSASTIWAGSKMNELRKGLLEGSVGTCNTCQSQVI